MTTTTKLGDFLGRALVNDNPGVSNAVDFLGRSVTASNKDFAGRALVDTPNFPPPDWAATTAYTVGTRARIPGTKEVQTLTASGSPSGNMKLDITLRGQTLTTGNIAISGISGATITAAIVALANVEPGDIVVTGSSSPFTVTIQEEFGDVAAIAVNTQPSGGTYAVATTTQGAALGAILECTVAGTSDSTKPTAPAVGATVVDATVTWKRLK